MSKDINVLCLNPLYIYPKSGKSHAKFPELQKISEDQFYLVPCGRCAICKYKEAREWANRIQMECEYYGGVSRTAFVTLTYNDESLPKDKSVHKSEVQNYIKRLRERLNGREIKYYAVGEYGDLYARAHYHLIITNVDAGDPADNLGRLKRKEKLIPIKNDWYHMHKAWHGKGFTDIQRPRSTGGVGGYVANYITKQKKAEEHAEKFGFKPPFKLMSKQLGLRSIIRIAMKAMDDPDTAWPLNFIERRGTDGKRYKFPLGRYLRRKLHQLADKLPIYRASKQQYVKDCVYKYAYLSDKKGISHMHENHRFNDTDQEEIQIRHNKIKFKLGEI